VLLSRMCRGSAEEVIVQVMIVQVQRFCSCRGLRVGRGGADVVLRFS
jgi:hypothetical protein